jgi:hypothetical protein
LSLSAVIDVSVANKIERGLLRIAGVHTLTSGRKKLEMQFFG